MSFQSQKTLKTIERLWILMLSVRNNYAMGYHGNGPNRKLIKLVFEHFKNNTNAFIDMKNPWNDINIVNILF